MIEYIALVIAFLGLPIGYLISDFTQEELIPGKKYFRLFKLLIFIAILIISFMSNMLSIYFFILLIFLGIYLVTMKNKYHEISNYLLFVLLPSIHNIETLGMILPLIFLYSMFSTTLLYECQ